MGEQKGFPQWTGPAAYDRVGGQGPEYRKVPAGGTIAKKDVYDWTMEDKPGTIRMIPKRSLKVDHEYQREEINQSRVNRIAAKWWWCRFGVLIVAARKDGSHWVLDGQHRWLAAMKRADIDAVPCLVFEFDTLSAESLAFLGINCDRSAVKSISRFRSMVHSGNPEAVKVNDLLLASGYIPSNESGHRHVKCVGKLMACMRADEAATLSAWTACDFLTNGESAAPDYLLNAMFVVDRHLKKAGRGSVSDRSNLDRFARHGLAAILSSIKEGLAYHEGRPRGGADGLLKLLNKGFQKRNRIPPIIVSEEDEG